MEQAEYVRWVSRRDELTPSQAEEAHRLLGEQSTTQVSTAMVEQGVGEDRRCRHCHEPGAIRHGKSRGLQRYRCKSCGRTFTAATNTPLSGLHYKERWLSVGASLAQQETVEAMAERCWVHRSTAFRWRHRFLRSVGPPSGQLQSVCEADETFERLSFKGSRHLERPPHRRGQPASQPGRSEEQVPILMAADRHGTTYNQVLSNVSAKAIVQSLRGRISSDAILVSDGHRAYPSCATQLGLRHEAVNLSTGPRLRGPWHIQTVNRRHGQWRDFLRPFRGVATKYLPSYLHWFHLKALAKHPTPRNCLAAAVAAHTFCE